MSRPRLLDLFCCAGGAGMGYCLAGFDVTGVDIEPQPRYPFEFVRADALEYVVAHGHEFDAIHASPPCQGFTAYKRRPGHVAPRKNLIPATRRALQTTGLPYVIENVPGAAAELINPVTLCGTMFGLEVRRHRRFETKPLILMAPVCAHGDGARRFPSATNNKHLRRTVEVGVWRIPLDVQQRAMGIDWMEREELSQAIPPAYTRWLGMEMMKHVQQAAA